MYVSRISRCQAIKYCYTTITVEVIITISGINTLKLLTAVYHLWKRRINYALKTSCSRMQRVSSASQLVEAAMSPYKRPRPQSPHGPHGIFYSPEHRFLPAGAHFTQNLYATPQREVRQHHVQDIPTINYQDHHPREVNSYSLQSQIRRRPSLLSEFHGGADRERERAKDFYPRGIEPLRLHTGNHHPDNDMIAAKRRRLDIENDTKFRPVHENSTSHSRVVTSSASQPEVKKEPFIPKVENVSPTPCDDESPSKVSKEGLLQAMEKMDREIQMVESQIANLKKKKQELEQRAAQPREEEKAVDDEDWEPKQENIIQIIYAENQRKAEAAHKTFSKCGAQNVLPLYNQMADEPNHQEILKRNYELSRRFVLYFKKQAAERNLREKSYCQLYNKRMEAWEKKMERIESNPKKKIKDMKTREFFEKQFPEIRKQREQQERFSSRAGTRSWGNIARSDAELAEIVDGLNEQEANERHMRSLTVIPPMLLEKDRRNVTFINKNGLVEDAMQEYKDRSRMNIWTDEEKDIFREKFMQHPKNFGAIAQFLERKSVSDCVLYYYQNKKRENYKQRKQQVKRKKTLPQKSSSSMNRNHDDEDKDDKEDGTSSQDPKKKDGDDKDGLNGGSSQNGETSTNGPPMSVPTNCALCHHSLDAYTMSRPLSKSNCELLGLNVNEVTANMRVCSKCRFRSLKKSRCPVSSCKTARRKAKRLKPLPTKWLEISEEQRKVISEELGITSEITKCCPACFNRITRRLSTENGPETDASSSSSKLVENHEGGSEEESRWTEDEISAAKQAFRKHGKDWSEIAKKVGSKTELQCRNFYTSFRRKHHLDQIIEEHDKEKKKREHRVSNADSVASTITAPSDDDLAVPSSDGENDADESSDTASASENEDGPLRSGRRQGIVGRTGTNFDKKKEVVSSSTESASKESAKTKNSNSLLDVSMEQEETKGEEVEKSKAVGGEGEGKSEDSVVGGDVVMQEKVAEEDGDTSATCSADEGNLQDMDTFSDSGKTPTQKPSTPARDRVSSSEDDTKLSDLKAKLEVEKTDSKTEELKKTEKSSESESTSEKPSDPEKKGWMGQNILNMRDLIDSAIHKHLGHETDGNSAAPAAQSTGATDKDKVVTPETVTDMPKATQPSDVPLLAKATVASPVPGANNHPSRSVVHPAEKAPLQERPEPKPTTSTSIEQNPSVPFRTSHITHTSQVLQDRDVYDVAMQHRQTPGRRSPGKRLPSPAYIDSSQNRPTLVEVPHTTIPNIQRGASPRGPSPHGTEREQSHLHSPPGRHNYSPRSTSSSPYALIPAQERHPVSIQQRTLPRTKPTTVPPPPPLNKLSPMTGIKEEKISPSGGVGPHITHSVPGGSITQGIPVNYMRVPDGPTRLDNSSNKAQNERLVMLARSRSPITSSAHPEYTGGSITQGTPLTRREQNHPGRSAHHQHERPQEKEAAIQKEVHQQRLPRVKVEQPLGAESMGWGFPIVPFDGSIPAELVNSLNDRETAIKMTDPSMLYMYTQRHLMQYGAPYNTEMVRGQYESGAHNSSKATLADDFVTAQRMAQRMPLPTTSSQSNPRLSPRHETPAVAKRGSPGHPPHLMDGIPGMPFPQFGLQQGFIMVPPVLVPGMTAAAAVPHQLHHSFMSVAPTLASPRSPHNQNAHTSNPHSNVPMDSRKNHSPSVHRDTSPSEVKMSRSWPGQAQGGHFKPPPRGPNPSGVMTQGSPYNIPIHRAPVTGGSIMQGTPVWRQQTPSITSGTPNPELRGDSRNKLDRGPSVSPNKSGGPSRRVDVYSLSDYNAARKDHAASIQQDSNEDSRRLMSHSSVQHDNHHQHPKRTGTSTQGRADHHPPTSMPQQERRVHREMNHPHYTISQAHDSRVKMEKGEVESKDVKLKASNATDLIANIFEKDPTWSNVKKEHEEGGGAFTAASLIDQIISRSINQTTEEEAQAESQSKASAPPPHSQPQHPPHSTQSKPRGLGSSLIDQLIVHQIKHESPEEKPPSSHNTQGMQAKSQGSTHFNFNERGGSHTSNHIDSMPIGIYRPGPKIPPRLSSRPMTFRAHIDQIVTKGYSQQPQNQQNKVPKADQVDSTSARQGLEKPVGRGESDAAFASSHQKSPRSVNEIQSLKSGRTVSPVESGGVVDSTVRNFVKRTDPGLEPKDPQSSRIDSTANRQMQFMGKESTEANSTQSSNRASPRDSRNADVIQLQGEHHDYHSTARNPHIERDVNRRPPSQSDNPNMRTSPHPSSSSGNASSRLPQQNSVNSELSKSATVNFPRNFQDSINRLIENQVRAGDNNPINVEDGIQGYPNQDRRPVSRGQMQDSHRQGDKVPMDGHPQAKKAAVMPVRNNGPPKSVPNKQELLANKENNIHSPAVNIVGSGPHREGPNPTQSMLPSSSHPSIMPSFPYPVLAFMPNHQPTSAAPQVPAAMHASPPVMAAAPRASPIQNPGLQRREDQFAPAPLLSSQYDCVSDSE